jgi:hypothetical protein
MSLDPNLIYFGGLKAKLKGEAAERHVGYMDEQSAF